MTTGLVPSGEGRSIAVGAHTVRFLHTGAESGYALIEWLAPPRIPGPPLHVHHATDEGFFVLEGAFGFQLEERTIEGATGAYLFGPREHPHTFWNAGPAPARLLIVISPSGFEQYFDELGRRLAAEGDAPDAAVRVRKALSGKYDIEVVGQPRQTADRYPEGPYR